jgi:hypothetical protein
MQYDNTLDRLERLAERQRDAFGYHIGDDGLPVWNTPSVPDDYTSESYAREQYAPDYNERD